MAELIYRTYSRGSRQADAQEVSGMIRNKPGRPEYEATLTPISFRENPHHHDGIIVGLPSERDHQNLANSLRRLGYFEVERKTAEPVAQPTSSDSKGRKAEMAYENSLVRALWEGVGVLGSG